MAAWRKSDGTWQPSVAHFTSLADPNMVGSGLTALTTLMHEAGHAAHFANIDMPSPLFSQERAPTSVREKREKTSEEKGVVYLACAFLMLCVKEPVMQMQMVLCLDFSFCNTNFLRLRFLAQRIHLCVPPERIFTI